jgi:hypothetical protein
MMLHAGLPNVEVLAVHAAGVLAACAALTAALLLLAQLRTPPVVPEAMPGGGLPKALFAAGLLLGTLALVQAVTG